MTLKRLYHFVLRMSMKIIDWFTIKYGRKTLCMYDRRMHINVKIPHNFT